MRDDIQELNDSEWIGELTSRLDAFIAKSGDKILEGDDDWAFEMAQGFQDIEKRKPVYSGDDDDIGRIYGKYAEIASLSCDMADNCFSAAVYVKNGAYDYAQERTARARAIAEEIDGLVKDVHSLLLSIGKKADLP